MCALPDLFQGSRGARLLGVGRRCLIRSHLMGAGLCLSLVFGVGCKSIGPGTVRRDQIHYSVAVSDSWKEQLLLNIVKSRYGDAPALMEVVSVVSGYSLETGVNLNGQFSPESLRGDTLAAAGVSGKYTDRPTISYSPMAGEKYARSLLVLVPLEALMFVLEGGVPADFIMGLTVRSFEGNQNAEMFGADFHAADPQFTNLLNLVRALQQGRVTESEILKREDDVEIWLTFHPIDPSKTLLVEQLAELKSILAIPSPVDRVQVVFGTLDPDPGVIAIRTRSLMQMMASLGVGVEIHEEHLGNGIAFPVDSALAPPGFKVRSGEDKPDEAFVMVPYEGLWFWIDRNDLGSKTTLAAVTMLFNFLEGGDKAAPVLTIPAH